MLRFASLFPKQMMASTWQFLFCALFVHQVTSAFDPLIVTAALQRPVFDTPDHSNINICNGSDDGHPLLTEELEACLLAKVQQRDRCEDAPCLHNFGIGLVYLKHNHKAGGTSLREAMRKVYCPWSEGSSCGGKLSAVVNEMKPLFLSSFPKEIASQAKVPPWLHLAINIRDPYSRIISLFEFEGRCGHHGKFFNGTCVSGYLHPITMRDFIDAYQTESRKIDAMIDVQPVYYSVSVSNYMVQMLCGRISSNITEANYQEAIKRLSIFHSVFITKHLSHEEGLIQYNEMVRLPTNIQNFLNLSCSGLSNYNPPKVLGHKNKANDDVSHQDKQALYGAYYNEIIELNHWDMKLYHFSVRLAKVLSDRILKNPNPNCSDTICGRFGLDEGFHREVKRASHMGTSVLSRCD